CTSGRRQLDFDYW
nr:immunoglobulin heavy chain junction region [Macaca mulatta]MOY21427.1 immunoglobulin heavy chain junction region [Macaca mulatta]MOY22387.1 immunoglobulin heavy chain junction region [Macaca mulatta]MOY22619.1 immunoglobulin heavy chain junction region [Macaca mulatta]MOY22813.1 immunoglobulin heavy chain junction region [Macaca mulatta]